MVKRTHGSPPQARNAAFVLRSSYECLRTSGKRRRLWVRRPPKAALRRGGDKIRRTRSERADGGNTIDEPKLKELLESIQQGNVSVDDALARLRDLPYESMGFAELDHHRALRTGYPEVILGLGKTAEQIAAIAESIAARSERLLITRADVEAYHAVKERVPDAVYHAAARAITLDHAKERKLPGVAVCCAGTSDMPVAEEAAVTAELMGAPSTGCTTSASPGCTGSWTARDPALGQR